MSKYTYEESVCWMRSKPELAETVKHSYLDQDNIAAAERFFASEEFVEVLNLLRLDKSLKKLKILDLGCGNGIAAYAFASLGHDVYAVDPDPSEDVGLGATKRLASIVNKGLITTSQAFAESLPFFDSTFDIVYARQSLHHFSDLGKGIIECSRVLKPDGIFLATREHVINDEKQLELFLESHILHKLHGGEKAYTLETYIFAIEKAGFQVLQCLAPFDTVINHFPISNAEVSNWLFKAIQKKLGNIAASIIVKIPQVAKFYRYRLSSACDYPGRPYTFLCVNKK